LMNLWNKIYKLYQPASYSIWRKLRFYEMYAS
jgi:hypothetical protein